MGPKKTILRSAIGVVVKEIGLLDSLPHGPFSKADILGRFNGIRRILSFKDNPCVNCDLSENQSISN